MANQSNHNGYVLGLDIGEKRIGVALASTVARLPEPLPLIETDTNVSETLQTLIKSEAVKVVVVGIPRNLDGQETPQSTHIREYTKEITKFLKVPVVYVDESLSSIRADKVLQLSGQSASRDSLAACFILEEYFQTQGVV